MINKLISIAKDAGQEALKIYETDFDVEFKDDKSPVTAADLAANKVICEGLQKNFPDVPILSEETDLSRYEIRKDWSKMFIVDPIDGTKEFVKKTGEFTVNIAYLENDELLAGVVYVPVKDIFYYAEKEEGAFIRENGVVESLPRKKYSDEVLNVVASKSHLNDETREFISKLEKDYGSIELKTSGSSIKLCLVAEGAADIYPRLLGTSEWDTAAAQCVVEQSGGSVLNHETRKPLCYNKENILNPFFIAARKEVKW